MEFGDLYMDGEIHLLGKGKGQSGILRGLEARALFGSGLFYGSKGLKQRLSLALAGNQGVSFEGNDKNH